MSHNDPITNIPGDAMSVNDEIVLHPSPPRHACPLPRNHVAVGSVAECLTCGALWRLVNAHWERVRWWHFAERRRIHSPRPAATTGREADDE
jgi:hypothetical protein